MNVPQPTMSATASTALAAPNAGSATFAEMSPSRQASTSPPAITTFSSASGSRNFQANAISWSMRSRGSVPRVQMNRKNTRDSLERNSSQPGTHSSSPQAVQPPRNSVTATAEIANPAKYSAV